MARNDINNNICLCFTGKDYCSITDAQLKVCSHVDEEIEDIIMSYKTELLMNFLKDISVDSLMTNHSYHVSKKNNEDEYKLFKYSDGKAYFDGLVGVVSKKNYTISSKKWYGDDTEDKLYCFDIRINIVTRFDGEHPFFLATMMLRDGIRFSQDNIPASLDNLYDYLLIFLFKKYLEESSLKGIYKTYKYKNACDEKIRGSIDIPRLIKNSYGRSNGSVPYCYRENSIDNNLNQLIVETYMFLKQKYPGIMKDNFDNNDSLRRLLETFKYEVSWKKSDGVRKNSKPITHPYYYEYEKIRNVCIQILEEQGLSLWDGDMNEEVYGFLFYIPDLWELFLEDQFRKKLRKIGVSYKAQGGKRGIKVLEKKGEYILQTYPDYVFYSDGMPYMILDAKFRPAWDSLLEEKKGYGFGYLLDDYTKCIRDMNTIGGHATGVIYPTIELEKSTDYFSESSVVHKISEFNDEDIFYVFPIEIPVCKETMTYSEWKTKFDDSLYLANEYIVKKIVFERTRFNKK